MNLQHKYICLKKNSCAFLCDAGTVLKAHCLHFMFTLVGDPELKLFFNSYDGDSFDSEFHNNCFFEVYQKLSESNIYICLLTSDNLPAQVRGWNTFIETSNVPMIKAIYRIYFYGQYRVQTKMMKYF